MLSALYKSIRISWQLDSYRRRASGPYGSVAPLSWIHCYRRHRLTAWYVVRWILQLCWWFLWLEQWCGGWFRLDHSEYTLKNKSFCTAFPYEKVIEDYRVTHSFLYSHIYIYIWYTRTTAILKSNILHRVAAVEIQRLDRQWTVPTTVLRPAVTLSSTLASREDPATRQNW